MKLQWSLLFGLIFAVIIALFAVNNVEKVPVNYVIGTAQWPLILVILGSALLGALLSGSIAIYRSFVLTRKVRNLEKELEKKNASLNDFQHVQQEKQLNNQTKAFDES
ncbi:lipopolysaccharide assembly protein LapA domain-containing protein [Psychrobacillus sp. PGGUH221]|uniref:LapA family protein n=1 Tax=Psychrobacillus sp. PGGUH221 TaxID=3020058 RepID=UPI0035C67B23